MDHKSPVPSAGQAVTVRGRSYRVVSVDPHSVIPNRPPHHFVELVALGSPLDHLQIIWEHEVSPSIERPRKTPLPHNRQADKYDPWPLFRAILQAHHWSSMIPLRAQCLLSPFHNALKVHNYQLVPALRTLNTSRINLFLADDVGLGKTIETGLLITEMLARRRIQRILILCPASLQEQWHQQLVEHFSLPFTIVNRQFIQQIQLRHGLGANPWTHISTAISSLDFLKREAQLQSFLNSLKGQSSSIRPWDLIVIDEAHHITPHPRRSTINESDRTRMARSLLPNFEHRLFISATPHNGFHKSFQALLHLLDPVKFSTTRAIDAKNLQSTMIRRSKSQISALSPSMRKNIPGRNVQFISYKIQRQEMKIHHALDQYISKSLGISNSQSSRLVTIILKKRLLSSLYAFQLSLDRHIEAIQQIPCPDQQRALDPSWLLADDIDPETAEQERLYFQSAAPLFRGSKLSRLLDKIVQSVHQTTDDSKLEALKQWLDKNQRPKLIIFTEYHDTLVTLERALGKKHPVLTLHSHIPATKRRQIIEIFNSERTQTAILIATDSAAEGLNLQHACSCLIHYDIPWNPARLEQRNGRIDRYGQTQSTVDCLHFLSSNRQEHFFLKTAILKIQTLRQDLGSVNQVIAAKIEQALLDPGKIKDPLSIPKQSTIHIPDQKSALEEIQRAGALRKKCRRKLQYCPKKLRQLVNQALKLHGYQSLKKQKQGWRITQVPAMWRHPNPNLDIQPGKLLSNQQLHLSHPLIKHAMNLLTQQHSSSNCQAPTRISFMPSKNSFISILLFYRISWFNVLGAKVHEHNKQIWGRLSKDKVHWLQEPMPSLQQKRPGPMPNPKAECLQFIETHSKQHGRQISKALLKIKKQEFARAHRKLKQARKKHIQQELQMTRLNIEDARHRLSAIVKQRLQLLLWPRHLLEQISHEAQSLELRLSQLERDVELIPKKLTAQFTLNAELGISIQPIATLYLFPSSQR
jgi:superfamily II DNA or RNA helicase